MLVIIIIIIMWYTIECLLVIDLTHVLNSLGFSVIILRFTA